MVDPEDIRRSIEGALPGARATVVDTTGAGDHFDVAVAAPGFAGKNLVEQHQMVYAALRPLMPRIHALAIRTEASEGAR
jgi:stress-induced morphogen